MSDSASGRVLAVLAWRWDAEKPALVGASWDLSSLSFFQRGTVKEHIVFHTRLVVSRAALGDKKSVAFEGVGNCEVLVHQSGLALTAARTPDYPLRVIWSLLNKALLGALEKGDIAAWGETTLDADLQKLHKEYADPNDADQLLRVQKGLDEVRDVMLQNIDDLLQRGEKLDDLMQKSEDLSQTSYQFYRQAKKNNQCCQYY